LAAPGGRTYTIQKGYHPSSAEGFTSIDWRLNISCEPHKLSALRPSTLGQIFYLLAMSPEPIVPSLKNYSKSYATKWARMGYWLPILLTFNFSLLISNCGLNIEDPTPPSPPVWIQKSLPEEWPERGIDAHESGGIYLEWEPNNESNIQAYHIYRAEYFELNDSLGEFEIITRTVTILDRNLTYTDPGVWTSKVYSYKLKAEDISENLSSDSDLKSYSLLPQIQVNTMAPNGITIRLNSDRRLSWNYDYNIEMEDYCITIIQDPDDPVLRQKLSPQNYTDGAESWSIPDSIILEPNAIYKWRIDTGANYVDKVESKGSESTWATFIY
jgi:hypothetical protein